MTGDFHSGLIYPANCFYPPGYKGYTLRVSSVFQLYLCALYL
jgi:hypothetical protein